MKNGIGSVWSSLGVGWSGRAMGFDPSRFRSIAF